MGLLSHYGPIWVLQGAVVNRLNFAAVSVLVVVVMSGYIVVGVTMTPIGPMLYNSLLLNIGCCVFRDG